MPRPPYGVYVEGDELRFFGRRKAADPAGLDWHDSLRPAARNLLAGTELEDLRWNGSTVVLRRRVDIDARIRNAVIAADDVTFENKRTQSMFLVLLDEINRLRTGAGLLELTVQQAKNSYHQKLDR